MEFEQVKESDYNAPLVATLEKLDASGAPVEPVSPDNPPWGLGWAFAVWFISVASIVVFPFLFLLPYMLTSGMTSGANLLRDPTAVLLNLAAIVPAHLLTLVLAWRVATNGGEYSLAETLGFDSGGVRWWHYVVMLAGFFGIAALVSYFIPGGDHELLEMLRTSRAAVFLTAALATFSAPIVEEVVFRGILFSALQRYRGTVISVGVVTLLFAAVHVPQYLKSPATIVLVTLLSLGLTILRAKTKNLWPCIVLHALFNGLQSLGLLLGISDPQ